MLEFINTRLSNIEKNISRIDEKLEFSLALQRNHLIRVKNGEHIDDSMILTGRPYNDLSPIQALEIYNNKDMDFILIDVSEESFKPPISLRGVIQMPLCSINTRYAEIQNKTIPILVISENGLKSILACEQFVKKGYFNVNNISGGYKFWREPNIQETSTLSNAG